MKINDNFVMINVSVVFIVLITLFYLVLSLTDVAVRRKTFIFTSLVFLVCLGIIGFHTKPYDSDDLTRYYYEIQVFNNKGIEYALFHGTWSDTILSSLFLFFLSRINIPEILPMIGISIIPFVAMWIIAKINRERISTKAVVVIMFVVGGFCESYLCLSAFRYSYGVAFAAAVIFADANGKIKYTALKVLLYSLLPFIHTSLMVVSIVALITHLANKKTIFIEVVSLLFINLAAQMMEKTGIPVLVSIAHKITMYGDMYSIGTSFGLSIACVVGVATLIFITLEAKKNYIMYAIMPISNNQKFLSEYIINFTVALFITFPFVSALFFRLYYLVVLLCVPILYDYIKNVRTKKKLYALSLLLACALIKWFFQYITSFSIWKFQ